MHTILLEDHRALGGKIVEFCGWQMPVQYNGVIKEHQTVRSNVGIFDVSHMGRVTVEGSDAENLLDFLSTNSLISKKEGTATYTLWCAENGTIVDDLIVYKVTTTKFFVVVNAGNRAKDLAHLLHYAKNYKVTIKDHYQDDGILALQGPYALLLISQLFPKVQELEPLHFISTFYQDEELVISRTGYTGEKGVEIYASNPLILLLWKELLGKGQVFGIEPIGLAARDTLRLEKGYALYGHELSESILAIESVSAWTIKWNKRDFLGKKVLESLYQTKKHRHCYGIILKDKGIAREGYCVLQEGKKIGVVTSGTLSPSLNQSIALVLVEKKLKLGDSVEVEIRQKFCSARVVDLPFYSKSSLNEVT